MRQSIGALGRRDFCENPRRNFIIEMSTQADIFSFHISKDIYAHIGPPLKAAQK